VKITTLCLLSYLGINLPSISIINHFYCQYLFGLCPKVVEKHKNSFLNFESINCNAINPPGNAGALQKRDRNDKKKEWKVK